MLRKNEKITLIATEYILDEDGFRIEKETKTDVFANVDSITGQEFYNTGLLNIKPSFRAIVWAAEYNREPIIERKGKRYGVYRTFRRGEDVELYCQEEMGLNDELF